MDRCHTLSQCNIADSHFERSARFPGSDTSPPTTYGEHNPPPSLRNSIICYWRRPADAPASTAPILPDGCIDLIWAGHLPPFIAGPMTLPVSPAVATGEEVIGVRFRPAAAPALLGTSAAELVNQHVSLRDIWTGPKHQLWADAALGDDLPARLAAISELIASQLQHARGLDPLVSGAAHWLAAHPSGNLDLLIEQSGLGERQLRRRFEDAIGYGPKRLQRILRLQRLLWLAGERPHGSSSLGQLAFAAGYADQPHMTREVLALGGATPTALLRAAKPRSAVSDLFKTPPR